MDFRTSTWALPVWAAVEGKLGGLVTISWRLKLRPWSRLLVGGAAQKHRNSELMRLRAHKHSKHTQNKPPTADKKRWHKRWSMRMFAFMCVSSHSFHLLSEIMDPFTRMWWGARQMSVVQRSDWMHTFEGANECAGQNRYLGQWPELVPGLVWRTLTPCKAAHCWLNWSLRTGHQTSLRDYQTCSNTHNHQSPQDLNQQGARMATVVDLRWFDTQQSLCTAQVFYPIRNKSWRGRRSGTGVWVLAAELARAWV